MKKVPKEISESIVKLVEMLDKSEVPQTDRHVWIEDDHYYIDKKGVVKKES